MNTVLVKAGYKGGTYIARAGRGKAARIASYTGNEKGAVQNAAAKFFGLDASNVARPGDIVVEVVTPRGNSCASQAIWRATLPAAKGGAS